MTLASSSGSKTFPWLSFFLLSAAVSAAPHSGTDGLGRRDNSSSNSPGSISMSVWLPILAVTMVFLLVSLCTCVRRCAANQAAASSTNANATGSTPANTNAANTGRNRRRPQRTPSQISTRSLPPYMKDPGDHELVLYRGPDGEDPMPMPMPMPTLAEDDEERLEMPSETFDVPLNRMESMDTMPDSSTTTLMSRPPELHSAMSHHQRPSGDSDSVGSEAELLATHRRAISVDSPPDPRGEAPPYSEAVAATATSESEPSSNPAVPPPSHVPDPAPGRARPRFSFLTRNPFSSHHDANNVNMPMRADSPVSYTRSGSAMTRISSRESHESHHSRTNSRNNNPLSHGHNHSTSSLFRAFHSQSPVLQAGSSSITPDDISAPLTHTVTRAEFRIPKGGVLTPEQVKLITSRDALERFGMPYGPDAVAAFSLSREMPPGFESVVGEGGGTSEVAVDRTVELDTAPPSPAEDLETRSVQVDEPRPATPDTARPANRH